MVFKIISTLLILMVVGMRIVVGSVVAWKRCMMAGCGNGGDFGVGWRRWC